LALACWEWACARAFADINPAAVKAMQRTVRENGLDGRVAVYRSDNLRDIPASERWDLVLGNPPHADSEWFRGHLITYDRGWRTHSEFFASVGQFLNPSGVIVLQENSYCSSADTFRPMIEAAGLCIVFVRDGVRGRTAENPLYYIGIARGGDELPKWVETAKS
jgi:methylase of polypeptide subunit release factors